MDEFRAEGRGVAEDRTEIGRYLRERKEAWSNDEAFRLQPPRQELEDARFVLDHQDPHATAHPNAVDDLEMTRR
jgi:hypothetical protein